MREERGKGRGRGEGEERGKERREEKEGRGEGRRKEYLMISYGKNERNGVPAIILSHEGVPPVKPLVPPQIARFKSVIIR
jgi:hypothetical protein